MKKENIDPDKLYNELQKLEREELLHLIERALEELPKTRFSKVIEECIDLEKVKITKNNSTALLSEVEKFYKTSLRRKYYDSFEVNSKNYMKKSSGTKNWIYECNQLFKQLVSKSRLSSQAIRKALSMLFELLRNIDSGNDEIIFFGDEAGSWQVGVNWDNVLPLWFKCLSETSEPEEFVEEAMQAIKDFVGHNRKKFISIARKQATAKQKKLLPNK